MRIGNLVECINGDFSTEQIYLIPNRPQKNVIYEIRKVLNTRNGKAVLLSEIENPLLEDPISKMKFEPSFHIDRFRIIDDNTELSLEIENVEEFCL